MDHQRKSALIRKAQKKTIETTQALEGMEFTVLGRRATIVLVGINDYKAGPSRKGQKPRGVPLKLAIITTGMEAMYRELFHFLPTGMAIYYIVLTLWNLSIVERWLSLASSMAWYIFFILHSCLQSHKLWISSCIQLHPIVVLVFYKCEYMCDMVVRMKHCVCHRHH